MTLQSMLWQVKFEEIDFVTAWITGSIRVSEFSLLRGDATLRLSSFYFKDINVRTTELNFLFFNRTIIALEFIVVFYVI